MTLTMSKVSDEEYEQEWLRRALQAQMMEEGSRDENDAAAANDGDGAVAAEETMQLTTEGDGSDRHMNDQPSEYVYCNIQEIIPGLFIGDYTAAIDPDLLREKGIKVIVAAMRQRYTAPEGVKIHRVLIDDTAKTNIIRHFRDSNTVIREARSEGKNVLVHCQAGVSRSTTLCAAYLMEEFELTADEAVEKIAAARSIVCPAEFFMHQLELYERCQMDPDPSKYPEYRRFLMNYMAQDMLDGDGVDQLILAYYPTPAPSPRRSPGLPDPFLSMTPMSGTPRPGRSRRGSSVSITSNEARSEIIARVRRGSSGAGMGGLGMTSINSTASASGSGSGGNRRMSEGQHLGGDFAALTRRKSSRTKSTGERTEEIKKLRALLEDKKRQEAQEVASKQQQQQQQGGGAGDAAQPKVVAVGREAGKGRRLRCKMCRRELAAREHILEHEAGYGQKAFAPRRRDMTQHRLDVQKKKDEQQAKEAEERRKERQRVASEAAEEILQEAEDAAASDSGEEEEEEMEGNGDDKKGTQGNSSASPTASSKKQSPSHLRVAQPPAQSGATPRSLASRLPPALAALRVAMPQPMSHDYSQNGSAIADDEPTPVTESPPSPPLLPSSACTSYFTEPLSWMRPQLENGDLTGKLLCPNTKCGAKLGNFDWSGIQCSCAAWICPGFALAASKVDEVKF